MNPINIEKILTESDRFVKERDWDQFHSIKNLAMALSVEASELLEIFQWMKEEESNNVATDLKTFAKVEEEVADVFIYLLRIVHKTGIDLEQAVYNKMKKNEEKYPVEKAKGNAKKYDEF